MKGQAQDEEKRDHTRGSAWKSVLCQRGAHVKIGPQRGVTLRIGCPVGIPVQ
jgi:hypothetical protein